MFIVLGIVCAIILYAKHFTKEEIEEAIEDFIFEDNVLKEEESISIENIDNYDVPLRWWTDNFEEVTGDCILKMFDEYDYKTTSIIVLTQAEKKHDEETGQTISAYAYGRRLKNYWQVGLNGVWTPMVVFMNEIHWSADLNGYVSAPMNDYYEDWSERYYTDDTTNEYINPEAIFKVYNVFDDNLKIVGLFFEEVEQESGGSL